LVSAKKSKDERRKELALARVKKMNKGPDWFVIGCVALVVLLVVGVAGFLFVQSQADKEQTTVDASQTTAPNTIDDGYTITKDGAVTAEAYDVETTLNASEYTSDDVNVTAYVDYACPHCAEFDANNTDQIRGWLEDGTIDSYSIHPIVFLSDYSLVGANAMQCVAEYDPNKLLDVNDYLIGNFDQGLKSKQVLAGIYELGVPTNDDFAKCVRGGKYNDAVDAATARAQAGPIPESTIDNVQGTPTILINGQKYPGDPSASVFAEYVNLVASGQEIPTADSPVIGGDQTEIDGN